MNLPDRNTQNWAYCVTFKPTHPTPQNHPPTNSPPPLFPLTEIRKPKLNPGYQFIVIISEIKHPKILKFSFS